MRNFYTHDEPFRTSRLVWTQAQAPRETASEPAQVPEQAESIQVRIDSREERLNYMSVIPAFARYKELKNDTRRAELAQQAQDARAMGTRLTPEEERIAVEYDQQLVEQLQRMTASMNQEIARTLEPGFTFEQMTEKVVDIIEKWGLKEAQSDLLRYYATQVAIYDIMKSGLGSDFEELSPDQMIERVRNNTNMDNMPGEVRNYIRTLGTDMPPGTTFGIAQKPIEILMQNSSLGKGSALLQGGAAVMGIMALTGVIANIVAPVFRGTMTLMKHITNPRTAIKEIRGQVVETAQNWKTGAKRLLGTGAIASVFLLASSDDPIGNIKRVRDAVVDTAGSVAEGTQNVARGVWERATSSTESHRLINSMAESKPENREFLTQDGRRNADILRRIYAKPEDGFNLTYLNDVRNADHLNQLANVELDTSSLPESTKRMYENGRRRLNAMKDYLATLNVFAEKMGTDISARNIKAGDLAKKLVEKYQQLSGQNQGLLSAIAERATNAYEATIGPSMRDVVQGEGTFINNMWGFVVRDVLQNKPDYYPGVERRENVPNIPQEQLPQPPDTIVPTVQELKDVGIEISEEERTARLTELSAVFAMLASHARRIENPKAFIRA